MRPENLNGSSDHEIPAMEPELISEEEIGKGGFTLSDLAREEDDADLTTGENPLDQIEVRSPGQQEWYRTHPEWSLSTRAVIDKRGTREVVYLMHKRLMPWSETLEQDSVPVMVRVCVNSKGKLFIWVIRKQKKDGTLAKNYSATLDHIQNSLTKWIRRFWVADQGRHVMRVAQIADEPKWPDGITFQQIIVAGFGDRIITDENAPILRELRGESHV